MLAVNGMEGSHYSTFDLSPSAASSCFRMIRLLQQHLETWTLPIPPICLKLASWKSAVSEGGGSPSYKPSPLANRLFSFFSVFPSTLPLSSPLSS